MNEELETGREEAKQALGYVDGAMVDYAVYRPESPRLPRVCFAYKPLTPNRKQELLRKRRAGMEDSSRLAVDLLAAHVVDWDLVDANGDAVKLDKLTIGDHVRDSVVEGIFELVMSDAYDEAAKARLDAFRGRG